jgi:hypothetical protein
MQVEIDMGGDERFEAHTPLVVDVEGASLVNGWDVVLDMNQMAEGAIVLIRSPQEPDMAYRALSRMQGGLAVALPGMAEAQLYSDNHYWGSFVILPAMTVEVVQNDNVVESWPADSASEARDIGIMRSRDHVGNGGCMTRIVPQAMAPAADLMSAMASLQRRSTPTYRI